MKRIDILICLELFNIRKQKSYPRYIIKDSYDIIHNLCSCKFLPNAYGSRVRNYEDFKKEFRSIYLNKSPIEFRYCQEFLIYLENFSSYVVGDLF